MILKAYPPFKSVALTAILRLERELSELTEIELSEFRTTSDIG
jgi:hypothetical protein